jgi:hypothetical protein
MLGLLKPIQPIQLQREAYLGGDGPMIIVGGGAVEH